MTRRRSRRSRAGRRVLGKRAWRVRRWGFVLGEGAAVVLGRVVRRVVRRARGVGRGFVSSCCCCCCWGGIIIGLGWDLGGGRGSLGWGARKVYGRSLGGLQPMVIKYRDLIDILRIPECWYIC